MLIFKILGVLLMGLALALGVGCGLSQAEKHYNAGVALLQQDQPERAIQDYDQALRLDPNYAPAYANRALTHALQGRDREAREDVERAVQLGFDRAILEGAIAELVKER